MATYTEKHPTTFSIIYSNLCEWKFQYIRCNAFTARTLICAMEESDAHYVVKYSNIKVVKSLSF